MSFKKRLLVTAATATVALIQFTVADGQTAGLSETPVTGKSKPATSKSKPNTITEVIVTAQRRSERLQDVPITVTAISGTSLGKTGITDSAQLTQVVPAFRMDYSGAFAQPTIRGVSTAVDNVGASSNVGVYIDGFYNPSPLTSDFSLMNVSSVQVVKGPQGTLFGRNTTGGAVLVNTSDPSWVPAYTVKVSFGNYNTLKTGLYATQPINDKVAVDFAALYDRSDGYWTNIYTDNNQAGRSSDNAERIGIKFKLGDDNSVLIRYLHSYRTDSDFNLNSVYNNQTTGSVVPGAIWGSGFAQAATDVNPYYHSTLDQATMTAKFDLGFAGLTSRSMGRFEHSSQFQSVDNSTAGVQPYGIFGVNAFQIGLNYYDHTYTQEFLLNSNPGGNLTWVAGVFYMNQTVGQPQSNYTFLPGQNLFDQSTLLSSALGGTRPPYAPNTTPGPLTAINAFDARINIASYAGFGDLTYKVFDKLYLTAGGRYSYEVDDGSANSMQLVPGYDQHVSFSFPNFSPRFVVRYEFNNANSVYASYSVGFKAGNADVNDRNRPGGIGVYPALKVLPEHLYSYEVGYKFQQGGSRLDLSGFYYDYKDLQESVYRNGTASFTTNAPASTIWGGELAASQQITDDLALSGGVAYTDAYYRDFPDAPINIFNPASGFLFGGTKDAADNALPRAPKWTGNVMADYVHPLAAGRLDLNGNIYFSSRFFFDPANQYVQNFYTKINLSATWTDPSEHWTFSAFGTNIGDSHVKSQVLPNSFSAGVSWDPPAMYGVSVQYKY